MTGAPLTLALVEFVAGFRVPDLPAAVRARTLEASGLMTWESNPSENARPFQMGMTARNGVTAALLAAAGFGGRATSSTTVTRSSRRSAAPHSLALTSRIRPDSLVREPYVLEQGLDFTRPLGAPVQVFEGSAREAALAFPKHFNVAVTLSLAGIGLERTRILVFADPDAPGAIHNVKVEADDIALDLTARNRPSPTNPRTSRAVAPSIMAALRSLVAPVQIGS